MGNGERGGEEATAWWRLYLYIIPDALTSMTDDVITAGSLQTNAFTLSDNYPSPRRAGGSTMAGRACLSVCSDPHGEGNASGLARRWPPRQTMQ